MFFSFHYENDVTRVMVVRNSWVTQGKEAAGFIDKAEFEAVKRRGDAAIAHWIDKQLEGTSVTVGLIGEETLERRWVQYEVRKSINRGNAVIGVRIHQIKDFYGRHSCPGNTPVAIGSRGNKRVYFDDECQGIYDYMLDNGYRYLGDWIERAARQKGK